MHIFHENIDNLFVHLYYCFIQKETKKCVELENFIKQNPMSTSIDIVRIMGQIP